MTKRIDIKEIEDQIRAKGKNQVEIRAKHAISSAVIGTHFGKACNYEMAMSKLRSAFFAAADELNCPIEDIIMQNLYTSCYFVTTRDETDDEFNIRIKRNANFEALMQRQEQAREEREKESAKLKIAEYQAEIEKLNQKLK
jgi:hypothetical protein